MGCTRLLEPASLSLTLEDETAGAIVSLGRPILF
jgi:hypothetical protein